MLLLLEPFEQARRASPHLPQSLVHILLRLFNDGSGVGQGLALVVGRKSEQVLELRDPVVELLLGGIEIDQSFGLFRLRGFRSGLLQFTPGLGHVALGVAQVRGCLGSWRGGLLL